MKTIVNTLRLSLLLGFMAIGMTVWSQIPHVEKMSISTQMFLDELAGKYNFDRQVTPPMKSSDGSIVDPDIRIHERHIARPDTIDGRLYASSFVRVKNENEIDALEAMGVIVNSRFDRGRLVTALIPVEKILDVAAIAGVEKIEVASVMETNTDNARQTTNAYDVLTLSNDALAAGLTHPYDGSGVILGVIDTGIDYQHIAFKDKNGNSRIKGAFCYQGSSLVADWTGSGNLPTTDNTGSDHGSHTCAIAGGSNVIVNGTNVTVTDDPSQATYGGMAPGADLFLAGLSSLYNTRIADAFARMSNYADAQHKPLVVSNSYGSYTGPHDGQSSGYSTAVNEIFGGNVSNKIALFSTGNEAGNADHVEGGGLHIYGSASSSNPLRSILRCHYYSNRDDGYFYTGELASIWCRSTSVSNMTCRILVLDTRTGEVLTSVNVNPTSGGVDVSGLSNYYSGTLTAYKGTSTTGKTQILLEATADMKSKSYDTSNSSFYISDYTLAIEVYPSSGTAVIDAWAQDYSYFSDYLTTSGYNWVDGSDDMTANDFANNPNIICVGSYISRERSSGYSLGDISKFSSYATAEANPLGKQLPWITAPGEVIISAYNHYNTGRSSSYVVSVNNTNNPYGQMSGTSMACPSAAGIVALWFQAAQEVGMDLTLSEVKEIMKETAIRDYWVTSGPHATHFGNGKINALAGIQYILSSFEPITAGSVSPDALNFGDVGIGRTDTRTVTVTNTGNQAFTPVIDTTNLPGEFTVSGNGQVFPNGSINLTVTYMPTSDGQQSGSFTITIGDQTYTVTVTGNGLIIDNTLTSNEVMIPAYHSDLQVGTSAYQFTEDEVILDYDMNLEYAEGGSDVEILVKNDASITGYDLKHRNGEDGSWALVGNVEHQGNSYVYDETTMTFGANETEMWFPMNDNVTLSSSEIFYVPVTVANGVVTQGNTYGAPIVSKMNDDVNLTVIISGSKSDQRLGGHWTHLPDSVEYCVYTTIVDILSSDLDGYKLKPYLYRAWVITTGNHPIYNFTRNDMNAIVGTTELETPYLLGEVGVENGELGQHVVIGEEWNPTSGVVKMQNAFGAPCNGAQISVIVRVYYQPGENQTGYRGNRDEMFGFAQEGGEENFDLPTGVMEIVTVKEVVDVTYVNVMGMSSNRPFDGVNIVVTRYSDGTTSTRKIIK